MQVKGKAVDARTLQQFSRADWIMQPGRQSYWHPTKTVDRDRAIPVAQHPLSSVSTAGTRMSLLPCVSIIQAGASQYSTNHGEYLEVAGPTS
jgi:hypothetical protein